MAKCRGEIAGIQKEGAGGSVSRLGEEGIEVKLATWKTFVRGEIRADGRVVINVYRKYSEDGVERLIADMRIGVEDPRMRIPGDMEVEGRGVAPASFQELTWSDV